MTTYMTGQRAVNRAFDKGGHDLARVLHIPYISFYMS